MAVKAEISPTSRRLSIRFVLLEPELSDRVSSKLKLERKFHFLIKGKNLKMECSNCKQPIAYLLIFK